MAWTTQQLAALETEIAQGTTRVTFEGRTVEYRSLAEMIRLRDLMRRELATAASAPPNITYATFSRGDGT
jgi:hypothetical protein